MATHTSYWPLFKKFPFVNLWSSQFLTAVAMTAVNNISWGLNFYFQLKTNYYLTRVQILAFYQLLVWAIPFVFFLALESDEYTLPSSGSHTPSKKCIANIILFFYPFSLDYSS